MKTKHADQSEQCELCDYKTASKPDLERHLGQVHLGQVSGSGSDSDTNKPDNFNMRERKTCDECGYKTTSECVLKRHIEMKHERTKKHTCDKCQKIFSKANLLKQHTDEVHVYVQEIPTEPQVPKLTMKRRTCNLCGKKFNKQHTYQTHMETIHEGISQAGKSINNNLISNYLNREEVRTRAEPVKTNPAPSVVTSEQDL